MNTSHLPFSQACENNKTAILACIQAIFVNTQQVLEIGSGTGQHAVHFAQHLNQLCWQISDMSGCSRGCQQRIYESRLNNIKPSITLDVGDSPWPIVENVYDGLFSANTLHIMPWSNVENLFREAAKTLRDKADLCFYGPFNYHGHYTSNSNAQFDQYLKQQNPVSGIRDFEAILRCAEAANMQLISDYAMPANNRLLHFQLTL